LEELGGPFDIVFASAVLLHLSVTQFEDLLVKAARAVHPKGLMAFTAKEGHGEAWTAAKLGRPRYFTIAQ
jgi:predicted TPR repeat methyltransferase